MHWQLIYIGVVAVVCLISVSQAYRYPPALRALSVLLVFILVVEITSLYLGSRQINRQFLFHIYTPVEYAFIGYLYAAESPRFRVPIWVSVLGFSLFCLASTLFWQPLSTAPSTVYRVEWILILVLVVNYLYDIYRSDALIEITRQPVFWISIGNFMYYAGTFFLMALISQIYSQNAALAKQLYLLNTFLNILMYALWGVGFLCNRTSPT